MTFRLALLVRLASCLVAIAGVLGTVSVAHAQDEKAQAIQLIKEANAATEAGEHREALMKYKAAFDLTEDARILYRVGLSYESLGNYQRAREHLELYLYADPESEYKDRIDKKIALLKEKEKTLQARVEVVSNPAGARVFVDGENNAPFGKTPLVLPVGPGKHEVVVKMGTARQNFTVTLEEGQTIKQTVELGPGAMEAEPGAGAEGATEGLVVTETGSGQGSGQAPNPASGLARRVDIAPPAYMLAIGWSLIGTAMVLGIAAVIANNSLLVYGLASASFIGGGLILWFNQDAHTDQLQRVGAGEGGAAKMHGAGWRLEF